MSIRSLTNIVLIIMNSNIRVGNSEYSVLATRAVSSRANFSFSTHPSHILGTSRPKDLGSSYSWRPSIVFVARRRCNPFQKGFDLISRFCSMSQKFAAFFLFIDFIQSVLYINGLLY